MNKFYLHSYLNNPAIVDMGNYQWPRFHRPARLKPLCPDRLDWPGYTALYFTPSLSSYIILEVSRRQVG